MEIHNTITSYIKFNRMLKNLDLSKPIGRIPTIGFDKNTIDGISIRYDLLHQDNLVKEQYKLLNNMKVIDKQFITGSSDKFNISIPKMNINFSDTEKFINTIEMIKLYDNEICKKAGYGNLKNEQTEYDENVRSAKYIDKEDFIVDSETIKEIEKIWMEQTNDNVRVEPYRINLYGAGDFFVKHKDTSSKNLIGTFMISMYNNYWCENFSSFGINIDDQVIRWNEKNDNYFGFYSDIDHFVDKIENGYRMNVSFKVYAVDTIDDINEENKSEINENILKELIQYGDIGLILNYKYSYDSEYYGLKGKDKQLYNTLIKLKEQGEIIDVEMLSVIVEVDSIIYNRDYQYESSKYESEDDERSNISIKVLPILEDYKMDNNKVINFYYMNKINLGELITDDNNSEQSGYLGNEYDENGYDRHNQQYLARAIIIRTGKTTLNNDCVYNLENKHIRNQW